MMVVVYFDQLLGAACTQKLVVTFFSCFSTFFVHFKAFSMISQLKSTLTKMFQPPFGCAQQPKAGQNTQQMVSQSGAAWWDTAA